MPKNENDFTASGIDLTRAEFVKEAHVLAQLPDDEGAEIAFAGRSNVGKSSTINALCRRRKLARTSRTPGRTQQFVVYEFGPERRLIDLPGFGFAKVSKSKRQHWSFEIPKYLESRRSLIGLVLVSDSRHPLRVEEIEILSWCEAAELPALLVMNKCDKLNQQQTAKALRQARQDVGTWPTTQMFSATAGKGLSEVYSAIARWFTNTD